MVSFSPLRGEARLVFLLPAKRGGVLGFPSPRCAGRRAWFSFSPLRGEKVPKGRMRGLFAKSAPHPASPPSPHVVGRGKTKPAPRCGEREEQKTRATLWGEGRAKKTRAVRGFFVGRIQINPLCAGRRKPRLHNQFLQFGRQLLITSQQRTTVDAAGIHRAGGGPLEIADAAARFAHQ